jgi:hypothetical protein
MSGFSYDANIVATGFLQREQKERKFFIAFLILFVLLVIAVIIVVRVLKYRETQLRERGIGPSF